MSYNTSQNDIKIIMRLKGRERNNDRVSMIDPKLLIQVLDSIENALFESDKKDVERYFHEYKEIDNLPDWVRAASLQRIREFRHNRLILTEARTGSIEITALVIAVSYFVLNATIKESFIEGYKQSKVHKNLTEFISRQIDNKASFIAERIRRVFGTKKRSVEVKSLPPAGSEPFIVEINIYEELIKQELEKPTLTLGEVIDKKY